MRVVSFSWLFSFFSDNSSLTPDRLLSFGLFFFEELAPLPGSSPALGYLECAPIWLRLLASHVDYPALKHWRFGMPPEENILKATEDWQEKGQQSVVESKESKKQRQREKEVAIPVGVQMWQNWQHYEEFDAQLRVLKSHLFSEQELVSTDDVHARADLVGSVKFRNQHLQVQWMRRLLFCTECLFFCLCVLACESGSCSLLLLITHGRYGA